MTNEQGRRLVQRVTQSLRQRYGRPSAHVERPALEELLLGILADGASERKAARALKAVSETFVDWNEVRISDAAEIAGVMPDVPDAVSKARAMSAVLQRVYEANSELSLDYLKERSPRDAARLVAGIDEFPEAALGRATVLSLGHEALPPTHNLVQVCKRLALLDDSGDHRLEKLLPRQKMYEFYWLISRHAREFCHSSEPKCPECVIRPECRTGRGKCGTVKTASDAEARSRERKSHSK